MQAGGDSIRFYSVKYLLRVWTMNKLQSEIYGWLIAMAYYLLDIIVILQLFYVRKSGCLRVYVYVKERREQCGRVVTKCCDRNYSRNLVLTTRNFVQISRNFAEFREISRKCSVISRNFAKFRGTKFRRPPYNAAKLVGKNWVYFWENIIFCPKYNRFGAKFGPFLIIPLKILFFRFLLFFLPPKFRSLGNTGHVILARAKCQMHQLKKQIMHVQNGLVGNKTIKYFTTNIKIAWFAIIYRGLNTFCKGMNKFMQYCKMQEDFITYHETVLLRFT
jgi:hypothetical protein